MNAIVVDHLVKRYGVLQAVDDISFEVTSGTCFGSLGPNGAGKTTLIRILTGLIRQTSGKATIAGFDVLKQPDWVRKSIGVVSQAMTTDLDLSGWENADIYARYYNVPPKERRRRIEALLDRVGLMSRAHDLVATYSGGMRRRLEIARGLIHRPRILFLDEPTIGLDPQSRRAVWKLLQQFREDEDLTIFLTTHYMDEADLLCDRIAIIDNGKILVMETPEGLKDSLTGRDIIAIEMVELAPERGGAGERERRELASVLSELRTYPFVEKILHNETSEEEKRLQVFVKNGTNAIPSLMDHLKKRGFQINTIGLKQPSLEDVFIHYTGREIRKESGKKVNFFIGAGVPRRMGG
ncbi:MAG: ATP-binding cassette domain-containing protein [Nitrospiria bacterium]